MDKLRIISCLFFFSWSINFKKSFILCSELAFWKPNDKVDVVISMEVMYYFKEPEKIIKTTGEVKLDLINFPLSLIPNVPIDATGILLSVSI